MEMTQKALELITEDIQENRFIYIRDFKNEDDFYEMYLHSFLKGGNEIFYNARIEEDNEVALEYHIKEKFNQIKENTKMKKIKAKTNGYITVNFYFTVETEMDVPEELNDEDVCEYISESPEWDKATKKAAYPEESSFNGYDDYSTKDSGDDGIEIVEED